MSQSPFFSVILPAYNRARMLRSALRTIAAQTFADFEVLIADDGSTDETPELVRPFLEDPRFKYLRQDRNQGVTKTRNRAIKAASGDWITNLDSDDFWLPERLESFNRFIKERPGASFVFSNSYVYRYGRVIGLFFDPARPIPEGRVPGHYAVGEEHLPYITTNLAVPRRLYVQHGFHREDLVAMHDNDLYARLLADGAEVGVIREPLAVRRMHDDQVTDRWPELYRESLKSLQAARTPEDVFAREKEKLAYETAGWLLKGLKPQAAREFLLAEVGEKSRAFCLYKLTLLPTPVLAAAKAARAACLKLRFHPAWAPTGARRAYDYVAPLIAGER